MTTRERKTLRVGRVRQDPRMTRDEAAAGAAGVRAPGRRCGRVGLALAVGRAAVGR